MPACLGPRSLHPAVAGTEPINGIASTHILRECELFWNSLSSRVLREKMFYSHQLLDRKAPLGQIWMAATMNAKMNRRKLNKLNIIKICEEILNPSVPMALRLSGILMGGVVIVYEKKVKLLYEDVNRLLVEINEAWKAKGSLDQTVLSKGKSKAKKEAITLPEWQETDIGNVDQSFNPFKAIKMEFQQTNYININLDNIDETYIQTEPAEEEPSQNFHQANVEDITLFEHIDLYQANTELYDRFERFDIDEEMETQLNFTSVEHSQMPTTVAPSPPPQDKLQRADEIQEQQPENQVNQQSDESKEAGQHGRQRQGLLKRKTRRPAALIMDFEQTMIPGHTYQSWLEDASDISSRRGKKKGASNVLSAMKIAKLMELPPLVYDDLLREGTQKIHYPAPLLELWTKNILPPHDSSSARTSPPQPAEPLVSSPPERGRNWDPNSFAFEDNHHGIGVSIENIRSDNYNPAEDLNWNLAEEITANIMNINAFKENEVNLMVTPGNSDDIRSIPSSASGHGNSEIDSGRSNQRRPSSRISSRGLEPVAEETDPNYNLSRLSENGPTIDPEVLVETGPMQTQPLITKPPADKITDSIRMQMKSHFKAPGAPVVESLNKLSAGLTKKAAAMLFYQTCVLASDDSLRVEQKEPYGDIFISKGAKM